MTFLQTAPACWALRGMSESQKEDCGEPHGVSVKLQNPAHKKINPSNFSKEKTRGLSRVFLKLRSCQTPNAMRSEHQSSKKKMILNLEMHPNLTDHQVKSK